MRGPLLWMILACLIDHAAKADGLTALQLQSQFAASPNSAAGQFGATTGDISAATVRASGATVSRTLASFLSEVINVQDYGATCGGTTDDTAAVQTAQLAAQARGGSRIVIPAGCALKLNGNVFTVSTNAWDWSVGSYIVGGGVQGLLDATQNNMESWSKASAYNGNENGVAVYDLFDPTTGAAAYQKNGLYVRTFQVDPSTYSNPTTIIAMHDAVGIESQANITGNNSSGRAWAYHGACSVDPGNEGQCISGEFEIYNNGAYEPASGQFNSKIGLHVTAMGAQDSTAGIVISGVQHWETELLFQQQSLRTDGMAWEMAASNGSPVASMSYDGTISTNGRVLNSTGEELAPRHPGVAINRYYYGVQPTGAGASISALSSRAVWAPFMSPQRVSYSKIGVNVSSPGPAGATCTVNIYKAADGAPVGSPLIAISPTLPAVVSGDTEASINQTLDSGLYFEAVSCSSDSVGLTTYVEGDARALMGGGTSTGGDTTLTSAYSGSYTVTPPVAYIANNNFMPQIWLRR